MTSAHAWLLQTLPHHAEEDREWASTWALTTDRNAARSLAEHTSGATRRKYLAIAARIEGYLFDFAGGAF